jgi:hypothetical protein
MIMKNGMIYEGNWLEGIIQGYGEIKWPSGNIYKGEFKSNKINGNGYLIWFDSSEKYIGQWTETYQNGLGIHIWYEPKGEQKFLRNRYVGEWRSGFRHGYGVFFYSNGSKYEGMWDQNYKHGFGVFTFHDGSQYVGRFHNDRMIDFNTNGLYIPGTLNKIADPNRNINSASTKGPASITQPKKNYPPSQTSSSLKLINENEEKINILNQNERKNLNFNRLEEIPESSETISMSATRNNLISNLNQNSQTVANNIAGHNPNENAAKPKDNLTVSNKQNNVKEPELNQYKTTLDLTDLIECDPDLENSMKEVENILLRHLTEMKSWYKIYTSKEKDNKEDGNYFSVNASIQQIQEINKTTNNFNEFELVHKQSTNNLMVMNTSIEGLINNDFGFCMELKDLWKFIRDSFILSSDFSLASFNRIFFKGPKNYIEMFMCPEELDNKLFYEYIYMMINKSKEDFLIKFKYYFEKTKKAETGELTTDNNSKDIRETIKEKELKNQKPSDIEVIFDLHSKHQVILLRQFYEAIVRMAYLRYFSINQPLHIKLNSLIENFIKQNMTLKKTAPIRKSNNATITDSSLNISILDMKVKNIESSMESYIIHNEKRLKILFKSIYLKSTHAIKKFDMTITYRFFYNNFVLNSNLLREFLEDKFKFIELINIYHRDKIIITEENKTSIEVFSYIESLLDCEFIFFEFCEMIFYITKKYSLIKHVKESSSEILKHLYDLIEMKEDAIANDIKNVYFYPKLDHHRTFERMIELKRQKEDEEKRKKMEFKRVELERKLMSIEDLNVMPEPTKYEESQSDESENDF